MKLINFTLLCLAFFGLSTVFANNCHFLFENANAFSSKWPTGKFSTPLNKSNKELKPAEEKWLAKINKPVKWTLRQSRNTETHKDIFITPDGKHVISFSNQATVRIYAINAKKEKTTVLALTNRKSENDLSIINVSNNYFVITGTIKNNYSTTMYDLNGNQVLHVTHDKPMLASVITRNEAYWIFVSGSFLQAYGIQSKKYNDSITDAVWSAEEKYFGSMSGSFTSGTTVSTIRLSPDGKTLYVGYRNYANYSYIIALNISNFYETSPIGILRLPYWSGQLVQEITPGSNNGQFTVSAHLYKKVYVEQVVPDISSRVFSIDEFTKWPDPLPEHH